MSINNRERDIDRACAECKQWARVLLISFLDRVIVDRVIRVTSRILRNPSATRNLERLGQVSSSLRFCLTFGLDVVDQVFTTRQESDTDIIRGH